MHQCFLIFLSKMKREKNIVLNECKTISWRRAETEMPRGETEVSRLCNSLRHWHLNWRHERYPDSRGDTEVVSPPSGRDRDISAPRATQIYIEPQVETEIYRPSGRDRDILILRVRQRYIDPQVETEIYRTSGRDRDISTLRARQIYLGHQGESYISWSSGETAPRPSNCLALAKTLVSGLIHY